MNNTPRPETARQRLSRVSLWELIVLFCSIFVLVALFAELLLPLHAEVRSVLIYLDHLICAIFFGDFVHRLFTARSKREYMKWGWIDLLSCIPALPYLRIGRVFQILRIVRMVRGIGSSKVLLAFLFQTSAKRAIAALITFIFCLIIFSAVMILEVETEPNSNIRNANDALWWIFTTITTVGYGDRVPVTTIGRILGVLLMMSGIAFIGTLPAFATAYFSETGDRRREAKEDMILEEIEYLHRRLEQMESKLDVMNERQQAAGDPRPCPGDTEDT